jgi:hypothetical protein
MHDPLGEGDRVVRAAIRAAERSEAMRIPLGHDAQGQPIDVPERAAAWRVRRHAGGRGRPGLVYGRDGTPLVVPITATAEDLRAEGAGGGTYRLEALDAEGRPLAGTIAVTQLDGDGGAEPAPERERDAVTVAMETLDGYREVCKEQASQLGRVAEVLAQTQSVMMKTLVGGEVIRPPQAQAPEPRNAAPAAAPAPPAADGDEADEPEAEIEDPQAVALDKLANLANGAAALVTALTPLAAPLVGGLAQRWFAKAPPPSAPDAPKGEPT